MTTPELIAAVAGSSVITGALVHWLGRHKENAEARKISADALSAENVTNEDLFHDIRKMRILVSSYEKVIDECRRERDALRRELETLTG